MEFRQLEAYIKVVELGSFSKAAKELHVSQPSVSTYISSLERELGATLLNRSTKTISPTLAGKRFLAKAEELIALRDESVSTIKGLSTDYSGEIRIIASSVPASYLLPKLLADFRKSYPNVSFIIEQADSTAAVEAIVAGRADIGFVGSVIENEVCEFQEFINEKLIFIGPASSHEDFAKRTLSSSSNSPLDLTAGRLSSARVYSLEDLLYRGNFISRELGSGTRIQYEKFFQSSGIDLKRVKSCVSMGNTQSIINSVASGLGISLVSELAARSAIMAGEIVELRCKSEVPQRKIYTVLNTRIKHSHLVKLFVEHIRQAS